MLTDARARDLMAQCRRTCIDSLPHVMLLACRSSDRVTCKKVKNSSQGTAPKDKRSLWNTISRVQVSQHNDSPSPRRDPKYSHHSTLNDKNFRILSL